MHYPISVSYRRKPIKFCSSDEDFVEVVYIVIKLWYSKHAKNRRFFCTHMVDFRRPDHINDFLNFAIVMLKDFCSSFSLIIWITIFISLHYCQIRVLAQFWAYKDLFTCLSNELGRLETDRGMEDKWFPFQIQNYWLRETQKWHLP